MRPVITDLVAVHGQRPCPYTSNVHGKSTHKIKTTKQNQEKSGVQPQKSGKTSKKAARTSEKQKRNEQNTDSERTKHRLRTNKTPTQNEQNTDSERTKTPPQNPERTQNLEQSQNPEQKKRCMKTPQKIYALFCEMEPIVLKNQTLSFCGLYINKRGNQSLYYT